MTLLPGSVANGIYPAAYDRQGGDPMIIFLLACIVSFVPSIALFRWLRDRQGKGEAYKTLCNQTLLKGAKSILLIILLSGCTYVVLRLTGIQNKNPLVYQALYDFIVLALVEEVVKYLAFRSMVKKTDYAYSWQDAAILMTIVGLGFGMLESVIYAFGASPAVVLIRGICIPHAGFGFLTGYLYGKRRKNGSSSQMWMCFLPSWVLHGLYDFGLSEEFLALNDNLATVALLLAALEIVLVLILVRFIRKTGKQTIYTEPLQE